MYIIKLEMNIINYIHICISILCLEVTRVRQKMPSYMYLQICTSEILHNTSFRL